jgi:estrogen-related receptor beta like 1
MDNSMHNILQAAIDPLEWKTELERVGPKLRTQQQLSTNEWRAHVDQTIVSKGHIERVLGDTQGDLQSLHK